MTQTSLNILVVDDDRDNASSLGELLELEGHQVRVVHSGDEAIAAAKQAAFDLAFMDVVMPGRNGVESFIEVRRVRPASRVFMMTGYSVEQLLAQAMNGGALGVLEKPFDPNEIIKLTQSVGPLGMVLAQPSVPQQVAAAGDFIMDTLRSAGMRCRRVDDNSLAASGGSEDVLVLDRSDRLIDGVDLLKRAQAMGHRGKSVLVPQRCKSANASGREMFDVSLSGILRKPFDPMELINKLPELAA
jgi:two-component system, NtrC family, response regulator HydG